MCPKLSFSLCCLGLALASFAARTALAQASEASPSASRRAQVSEVAASTLVAEKTPIEYPDAARNAGIQGIVVLKVVVSDTGEVKAVNVISGDPLLAQAAADVVHHWKYKPYVLDGGPVEMETQVSINFHLKSPEHTTPPLGTFRDGKYSNEFFDFEYPLSRDWVLETQATRKRVSASGPPPAMYVLMAAVHIPQQTAPLEADSSFVLSAIDNGGRSCEAYLKALGDSLHSQKDAQQKGLFGPLSIAGRQFYRADFDFRQSPSRRSFLCTQSKDYLLQWNIVGLSKGAVEGVVSTLNAIGSVPSKAPPTAPAASESNSSAGTQNQPQVMSVRIAPGVSQGLIIRKIPPVYPPQAKYARIQGSVLMSAVISRNGDVVDLEVLDGPIELAVSAVNAVRQWKYRPYLLKGEPVEVHTQITVNYVLSGV